MRIEHIRFRMRSIEDISSDAEFIVNSSQQPVDPSLISFRGDLPLNFRNRISSSDQLRTLLLQPKISPILLIDLSFNPIGNAGLVEITRNFPQLKVLKLRSCEVTLDEENLLHSLLPLKSSLELLDLSRNPLGLNGGFVFAKLVYQCIAIRSLDISDCDLTFDSLVAILFALSDTFNPPLEHLFLSNSPRCPELPYHISRLIFACKRLQTLDLSRSGLTDEGIHEIVQALKYGSTMRTVNLAGNKISCFGIVALSQWLRVTSTFRSLNLSSNGFGSRGDRIGAAALAETLGSLTDLDVSKNALSGDGLVDLLIAGLESKEMKNLKIWANDWSEETRQKALGIINARPGVCDIEIQKVDDGTAHAVRLVSG